MTATSSQPHPPEDALAIPAGVRYARWGGHFLGIILIGLGILTLLNDVRAGFDLFQSVFFIVYGIYLNFPFLRLRPFAWKCAYIGLVVLSVAFVFVMIATVMFAYMAAAERGERLGVPGFEGTLIFLALMQVPAVLFQRKPDLLD